MFVYLVECVPNCEYKCILLTTPNQLLPEVVTELQLVQEEIVEVGIHNYYNYSTPKCIIDVNYDITTRNIIDTLFSFGYIAVITPAICHAAYGVPFTNYYDLHPLFHV